MIIPSTILMIINKYKISKAILFLLISVKIRIRSPPKKKEHPKIRIKNGVSESILGNKLPIIIKMIDKNIIVTKKTFIS